MLGKGEQIHFLEKQTEKHEYSQFTARSYVVENLDFLGVSCEWDLRFLE